MQKQDISIGTLVDMYKRGDLRLPAIQRHYVWRATRVRDLLDSLYRGYPSGSILMWETDEPVPTRESAISQDTTAFTGRKLLLDGQQRLTSLTAVLAGELIHVRGRKKPIDILFNLEHPDGAPIEALEVEDDASSNTPEDELVDDDDDADDNEEALQERLNRRTFVVYSKALASRPNWVSVTDIFKSGSDADVLEKAGIESFKDPRFQKYSDRLKRLRAIKDYSYVVHVLERAMSYEEVTEIFVRVNSLGAKLRASDLALAQMTSRWPELLGELEDFQEECEQNWFTLELGQLVRAVVVFATQQSRFLTVGNTPIAKFKAGWEEAKEGLRFAINFLRTNAGIEDESLLTSPMLIHVLAAVSRVKNNQLTSDEQRALLHWLLVANAKARYSGSAETALDEDLAIVFRSGDVTALMEPLRRQFVRLHIEPSDLARRGVNSSLFSLAYLALKDLGAKDWHSGLGLSLTHQGKLHFIQWHHIIPKSLLKVADYDRAEINEIANMAFITGQTNRRISNKDATKYLADVVAKQGEEALVSQCVPTDRALWDIARYRDFLEARRVALAERMNAFVAEKAGTRVPGYSPGSGRPASEAIS